MLLEGKIEDGGSVVVDADTEGKLSFNVK
jgi:hypothetical protein